MSKEVVDGKQTKLNLKTRYPKLEFDRLKMYFGDPYTINLESAAGSITILMPSVGDIVDVGEKKFNNTLNIFITNTTAYRLVLDEMKIDWNTLSDFELFCMLYKSIDQEVANLLFKDIDFSQFDLIQTTKEDKDVFILKNTKDDIEINEDVYQHIAQYLRAAFNMWPEEKITTDPTLKALYIQKDKRNMEIEKRKKAKKEDNSMLPLISACVNHPGFKYKLLELRRVNICEFYDSVKRLQIYENTTALLKGSYSGMIDSSHIDKEQFNFMREI